MRRIFAAVGLVVVLLAAWWGWALSDVHALAAAAREGDAATVMRRVDLPALTRSLAGQIAKAWLEENPQFKTLPPAARTFVGGAGAGAVARALQAMLTPDIVTAVLAGNAPGAGPPAAWRMPPLEDALRGGAALLSRTGFDGPLSFVVGLADAEGRYAARFRLSGGVWKLSGVDAPEAVGARLLHEVASRIGAQAGGG